jgi:hypothetical protein
LGLWLHSRPNSSPACGCTSSCARYTDASLTVGPVCRRYRLQRTPALAASASERMPPADSESAARAAPCFKATTPYPTASLPLCGSRPTSRRHIFSQLAIADRTEAAAASDHLHTVDPVLGGVTLGSIWLEGRWPWRPCSGTRDQRGGIARRGSGFVAERRHHVERRPCAAILR